MTKSETGCVTTDVAVQLCRLAGDIEYVCLNLRSDSRAHELLTETANTLKKIACLPSPTELERMRDALTTILGWREIDRNTLGERLREIERIASEGLGLPVETGAPRTLDRYNCTSGGMELASNGEYVLFADLRAPETTCSHPSAQSLRDLADAQDAEDPDDMIAFTPTALRRLADSIEQHRSCMFPEAAPSGDELTVKFPRAWAPYLQAVILGALGDMDGDGDCRWHLNELAKFLGNSALKSNGDQS